MSFRIHRLALAGLVIGAAGAVAGFATASPTPPAPAAPAPAPAAARPDDGAEYKKILDTVGDALVTVKFVMKSPDNQGFGGSEEEINGMVIDPKGLVLCSYWFLGGMASLRAEMMGGGAAEKPQEIRVLIGDDTEGKKARLIAHDSELDLAWIKLDEEPTTPLKHLDIAKSAEATVGQRAFMITRLAKYFDRAMVVNEGRIRGEATKPRHLYAPGGTLLTDVESELGLPVFDADAAIVGFVVLQIPDKESMAATENIGGGPMILPASQVAKATKFALEAAEQNPQGEEKKADAPAEPKEPEKKD